MHRDIFRLCTWKNTREKWESRRPFPSSGQFLRTVRHAIYSASFIVIASRGHSLWQRAQPTHFLGFAENCIDVYVSALFWHFYSQRTGSADRDAHGAGGTKCRCLLPASAILTGGPELPPCRRGRLLPLGDMPCRILRTQRSALDLSHDALFSPLKWQRQDTAGRTLCSRYTFELCNMPWESLPKFICEFC